MGTTRKASLLRNSSSTSSLHLKLHISTHLSSISIIYLIYHLVLSDLPTYLHLSIHHVYVYPTTFLSSFSFLSSSVSFSPSLYLSTYHLSNLSSISIIYLISHLFISLYIPTYIYPSSIYLPISLSTIFKT